MNLFFAIFGICSGLFELGLILVLFSKAKMIIYNVLDIRKDDCKNRIKRIFYLFGHLILSQIAKFTLLGDFYFVRICFQQESQVLGIIGAIVLIINFLILFVIWFVCLWKSLVGVKRKDGGVRRMKGGEREKGVGGRKMEEKGRMEGEGGVRKEERMEEGGGVERKLNFFYLNEFFRIFMVVDMLAVSQGLDLLSPYNVVKFGSKSVGLRLLIFFIK